MLSFLMWICTLLYVESGKCWTCTGLEAQQDTSRYSTTQWLFVFLMLIQRESQIRCLNNALGLVCTCNNICWQLNALLRYRLPRKTTANYSTGKENVTFPAHAGNNLLWYFQDFGDSLWFSMSSVALLQTLVLVRAKPMLCCSKGGQNV